MFTEVSFIPEFQRAQLTLVFTFISRFYFNVYLWMETLVVVGQRALCEPNVADVTHNIAINMDL